MDRLTDLQRQFVKPQVQVCLLAGSQGSHYNACIFGSNSKFRVNLLTRRPDIFASRIVKGIYDADKSTIEGKLDKVSSSPAVVCKGTKIFIVSSPVNAQEEILRSIKPFVEYGSIIGSVYGQGGFDLIAESVFGEDIKNKNLAIFALFNIPSTCKVTVPGKEVVIIGPKKYLNVAVIPRVRATEVQQYAIDLWRVPVTIAPNFLAIMMTPGNQIIHTGRLLGLFDNKKAIPLKEIPFFYTSLNQISADNMEKLSDEIQAIKKAIVKKYPAINLDLVLPLKDRIIAQYGDMVKDTKDMFSVFTTNTGYRVMTVPMVQDQNKEYLLNTKARTFVEDIPFGLVVLKDLAEKVDVQTPFMDKCIEWHQEMMGKTFIKDGRINSSLLAETGAPSKYGYKTMDELVKHYSQ